MLVSRKRRKRRRLPSPTQLLIQPVTGKGKHHHIPVHAIHTMFRGCFDRDSASHNTASQHSTYAPSIIPTSSVDGARTMTVPPPLPVCRLYLTFTSLT